MGNRKRDRTSHFAYTIFSTEGRPFGIGQAVAPDYVLARPENPHASPGRPQMTPYIDETMCA